MFVILFKRLNIRNILRIKTMSIIQILLIITTILVAYLLGAIPTAYIMCKKIANVDIREHGSGNVGAVNTRRVIGTKFALLVLIIDLLKGVAAVLIALYVQYKFNILTEIHFLPAIAAFIVVFGHSKSVFINFAGGKGAATGAGTLFALYWPVGAIVMVLTLLLSKVSKFRSLGMYIAVPLSAVFMWLFNQPLSYIIYCVTICIYILYLYRSNLHKYLTNTQDS